MNFNSLCIKNNSFKIGCITPHHLTPSRAHPLGLFLLCLPPIGIDGLLRHIVKPYKTCFNKDFYDSGINTPPNRFPLKFDRFK